MSNVGEQYPVSAAVSAASELGRQGDGGAGLVNELQQRVDELETLFALAPVALAIGRDPECRVIDANPEFRRLLRLSPDANASRTAPAAERPEHFRVLAPDGMEIPPSDLPMQACARTGLPVNGSECHVQFDDGSVVHLLGFSAPLFDERARPRGCIGAFIDISLRKSLEAEQALAREAAEAADRAKSRFLAVLSHELRGPLSPIVTMLAIWDNDPGALPQQMKGGIEVIRRNVTQLRRLVDDMMDAQGIAAGKLVVRPEPLDLHDVLGESVEAHRSACEAKGVALTYHPRASNARTSADRARLNQVFGNLLRNAIKFTAAGTIEVSTDGAPADAAGAKARDAIRVHVRDTGIGLAEGVNADLLFEPFEQGGAGRTQQYGGLGLGLAICRALVTAHGGQITASSDGPGTGTTVTVDLPLDQSAL